MGHMVDQVTCSSENIGIHLGAPGSSLPPLITNGPDKVLVSMSGSLGNPYTYLLRCLKHYYPNDFFKAVNKREQGFREELYGLFDFNIIK